MTPSSAATDEVNGNISYTSSGDEVTSAAASSQEKPTALDLDFQKYFSAGQANKQTNKTPRQQANQQTMMPYSAAINEMPQQQSNQQTMMPYSAAINEMPQQQANQQTMMPYSAVINEMPQQQANQQTMMPYSAAINEPIGTSSRPDKPAIPSKETEVFQKYLAHWKPGRMANVEDPIVSGLITLCLRRVHNGTIHQSRPHCQFLRRLGFDVAQNTHHRSWLQKFHIYKTDKDTSKGKSMSAWIAAQRRRYANKKLEPIRVALLESVGIDWESRHTKYKNDFPTTVVTTPTQTSNEEERPTYSPACNWNEEYQALVELRKNPLPPDDPHAQHLEAWQWQQLLNFNNLNEYRRNRLEEVGVFAPGSTSMWSSSDITTKEECAEAERTLPWDEMYADLKACRSYIEYEQRCYQEHSYPYYYHFDCLPPFSPANGGMDWLLTVHGKSKELGKWLQQQYTLLDSGAMSVERQKKLASIGIVPRRQHGNVGATGATNTYPFNQSSEKMATPYHCPNPTSTTTRGLEDCRNIRRVSPTTI